MPVRIDTFPILSSYELRDKTNLQRQVDGEWLDFQTELGDIFGQVYLTEINWDMQADLAQYITCPIGKQLVVIEAWCVFTPGNTPTGFSVQISIVQGGNTQTLYAEFPDNNQGKGELFYLILDPTTDPWGGLTSDAQIAASIPVGGFGGDTRIYVLYTLTDPV